MENKIKKAVLFDLDGTLLDTLEDLTDGVNYVMRSFNQPEHSKDAVRSFVGNGVRNLMRKAVPGGESNPTFEEQLALDIEYYRNHNMIKTAPYEGICDMLRELRDRGLFIAVLSNKDEVAVRVLCEHFFPDLYDLALGNVEDRPRKPNPAIVEAALDEFDIAREEVLYVGDSETDAATASHAKTDCLLVSWGFRGRDVLDACDCLAVIDEPEEVLRYV